MTDREAINNLEMCRDLMLFDPMHGDIVEYDSLNAENKRLHDACGVAIAAIRERMERGNGCDYCKDDFKFWGVEICGYFKNSEIRYCLHCGRKLPLPKPPEEDNNARYI